jgi:hypothetical protein
MTSCKTATWLLSGAAALELTACGVTPTPETGAGAGVDTTGTPPAGPSEPNADEPGEDASSDTGSDVPWHLLPEDDRPQPVDQTGLRHRRLEPGRLLTAAPGPATRQGSAWPGPRVGKAGGWFR